MLLHSCKQAGQDNTIEIAVLKGPSAMGMIYMIDSLKTLHGQSVNFKIYDEPVQLRGSLLQKEAEIAFVPTNMAAVLYNKGLPYQIHAISIWGSLYLVTTDNTIATYKSRENTLSELSSILNGKTIHSMARGLNPDIILRCILEELGINPNEDNRIDYSFPSHIDLANAVAAGLVDLAVLSEPLLSLARDKNPHIRIIADMNDIWGQITTENELPLTGVIFRTDFAKQYPAIVNEFDLLAERSSQLILQDPVKAAKKIVYSQILPKTGIAEMAISGCIFRYETMRSIRKSLDYYLKVFYNFDPVTIGNKLPDENFYLQIQ